MDALALGEREGLAVDRDRLPAQAAEVDLDAMLDRVVERLVREGRQVEVGAELAVDAGQQVEREPRGDAGLVVSFACGSAALGLVWLFFLAR